jgi:GNAT superfamily N-acetyltransferase
MREKPERLSLWSGDKFAFWSDFRKMLDNHQKGLPGETGLAPEAGIAQSKKNVLNDLLNLTDKANADKNPDRTTLKKKRGQDSRDRVIASRRLDRILQLEPSSEAPLPIDYGKVKINFLPNDLKEDGTPDETIQPSEFVVYYDIFGKKPNRSRRGEREFRVMATSEEDAIAQLKTREDFRTLQSQYNLEHAGTYPVPAPEDIYDPARDGSLTEPPKNPTTPLSDTSAPGAKLLPLAPTQEQLDKDKAALPAHKIETHERWPGTTIIEISVPSDWSAVDEVIGYASVTPMADVKRPYLSVNSTFIEKGYRGKGYGNALYRAMARYAQERGLTEMYGDSVSSSAAATRNSIFGELPTISDKGRSLLWEAYGDEMNSHIAPGAKYLPEILQQYGIPGYGKPFKKTKSEELNRWIAKKGQGIAVWHSGLVKDANFFSRNPPIYENDKQEDVRFGKLESLGFHFGTKTAALDRAASFEDHYEDVQKHGFVHDDPKALNDYVIRGNFLRTPDMEDDQIPTYVLGAIWNSNPDLFVQLYPDREEAKTERWRSSKFFNEETVGNIRARLQKLGYDGIVYKNEHEDEGKDAYVVFNPKDIKELTRNSGGFREGARMKLLPDDRIALTSRIRDEHRKRLIQLNKDLELLPQLRKDLDTRSPAEIVADPKYQFLQEGFAKHMRVNPAIFNALTSEVWQVLQWEGAPASAISKAKSALTRMIKDRAAYAQKEVGEELSAWVNQGTTPHSFDVFEGIAPYTDEPRTIFRGIALNTNLVSQLKVGDTLEVDSEEHESWSTSPEVARRFATLPSNTGMSPDASMMDWLRNQAHAKETGTKGYAGEFGVVLATTADSSNVAIDLRKVNTNSRYSDEGELVTRPGKKLMTVVGIFNNQKGAEDSFTPEAAQVAMHTPTDHDLVITSNRIEALLSEHMAGMTEAELVGIGRDKGEFSNTYGIWGHRQFAKEMLEGKNPALATELLREALTLHGFDAEVTFDPEFFERHKLENERYELEREVGKDRKSVV